MTRDLSECKDVVGRGFTKTGECSMSNGVWDEVGHSRIIERLAVLALC